MSQFIYMNERIRQKHPKLPVVVCQSEGGTVEANQFTLRIGSVVIGRVVFDKRGLDVCETHDVKAWVELNDNVDVIAEADVKQLPLPLASEKRPNRKVQLR